MKLIAAIALSCLIVAACAGGSTPGDTAPLATRSGGPATTVPMIAPSAATSTAPGQTTVTVTGHVLLERSETEFTFSDGSKTYDVLMDLSTRCVNLRGKLLGGYQIVSRIAMVTSLPLTITGTRSGSTIKAQTVLLPTDKDTLT